MQTVQKLFHHFCIHAQGLAYTVHSHSLHGPGSRQLAIVVIVIGLKLYKTAEETEARYQYERDQCRW